MTLQKIYDNMHIGIIALLMLAGGWMYLQTDDVNAEPLIVVPTLPAPQLPSLLQSSAMSNVSAALQLPQSVTVNAPANLEASLANLRNIAARVETAVQPVATPVNVQPQSAPAGTTENWRDADGDMVVGQVGVGGIKCAYLQPGGSYVGPAEQKPLADQLFRLVGYSNAQQLCNANGAYYADK